MQRRVGKSARVNQVSIDQVDPEHVQVEQVWSDIWEQQRLQRALDATRGEFNNNKTFQAFEQHVIKSKKVQDVMRDLDMSESSVHRARSRVAAALRRRLDDLEETEG